MVSGRWCGWLNNAFIFRMGYKCRNVVAVGLLPVCAVLLLFDLSRDVLMSTTLTLHVNRIQKIFPVNRENILVISLVVLFTSYVALVISLLVLVNSQIVLVVS